MDASLNLRERFTRAYEEYAGAIAKYCMQQGADPADAEEYTQEAFLRTWEYLASGKEVLHLKTFLYQVASNVMIDEVRRKKRKRELSLDALHEQGFDPGHDDRSALQKLMEAKIILYKTEVRKEYKLLVMRYIHGFPVRTIASMIGQTPNAVAVRLHRAVKRLSRMSISGLQIMSVKSTADARNEPLMK
ncbi:MAG: sigma-70 family RNA polymerase sigma factor [Patescibacteria group bacterium]